MISNAKRLGPAVTSVLGLVILMLGSGPFANEEVQCIDAAGGPAFFVSPIGNDFWSGLLAEPNADGTDGPFATLARARDAMRADPDIDITYVREGTYELGNTLQLTSEDTGISFVAYADEIPILSGSQAGLGTIIKLDNSDDVNILGLTFSEPRADPDAHLSGFAMDLSDVDNATIAYNTFVNVNIAVNMEGSSNNAILSNEMGPIGFQAVRIIHSSNNTVLGNHIHDIGGTFSFHAAGVFARDAQDNVIAHNLIEDSARYAVSISDGGSNVNTGNVVEYNKIFNTSKVIQDSGAIQMLGRSGKDTDTAIRYNYIENTGAGKIMASGIYLDDLTSGVEVIGNFIKGTGLAGFHLHGGRNITIKNNVVILFDEPIYTFSGQRMGGHEIFVWEQIDGSRPRLMENIEWSSNIISAPGGLTPDADYWRRSGSDLSGEPRVSNNLLHNVDRYDGPASGTADGGSIFADPLFVDPANGDYSLQAGSPAFDLGFEPLPFAEMGPAGFEILDSAVFSETLAIYLGYNPVFGSEGGDANSGLKCNAPVE